jgi:hypothetical protein
LRSKECKKFRSASAWMIVPLTVKSEVDKAASRSRGSLSPLRNEFKKFRNASVSATVR